MTASPPNRRKQVLWWMVGWLMAVFFLVAFTRAFDVRAAWHPIAEAKLGWIAVALLANFAVLPLLTVQWRRLLPKARPIRWKILWECVTLSLSAMNTIPFGGGHAVTVALIAQRGGAGWPGALSLLALEQLCDAFAKLALILAALSIAPLPAGFRTAARVLTAMMVVGLGVLLWLAHHPANGPATGWRAKWGQHLEVLKNPGLLSLAVGLSLAIKLCGLVAIYAVQRSLGVELPFATTPLVLAAVTLATLVSISPSDLGVHEAATFGAYRLLGVAPGEAAALGLVQHACFFLPIVGTGYALTFWRMMTAPGTSLPRHPAKSK
ncbi:MAG: lysylphosphatidylglycerol synthase transmembrane domain-containing protein [Opitutaceae bacterium]